MKAEGEKMDAESRRKEILKLLTGSDLPVKGQEIAERFDVTRQVVVKDLAILKAKNPGIVSTYGGYLMLKEKDSHKRIFRVKHDSEGIYEELRIILKYGGIVEDIIIDHPYYGELRGNLFINSLNELDKFLKEFKETKALPLSELTGGIHMHTVTCQDEKSLDLIEKELSEKGYLTEDVYGL